MKGLKVRCKTIYIFIKIVFEKQKKVLIFATAFRKRMCFIGEMAERSNAAVLKTVDCNRSGGSNPSFSAELKP
jgi:hypothetical protein